MRITAKFDVSRMNAMLTGIARGTRKGIDDVVKHEATKIFEGASKNTKAAKAKNVASAAERQMIARYNTYASGAAGRKEVAGQYPRISHSTRNGRTWWRESSGGKWYLMSEGNPSRRWSDKRWNRFKADEADRKADLKVAIAEEKKRRLRARGLAKRSWLEIAKKAGIPFPVRAYVANARPAKQELVLADFIARILRTPESFAIYYENALPYISAIGGEAAIIRAINGRIKYFETTMSKMTGDVMEGMAKRYGGLVTR